MPISRQHRRTHYHPFGSQQHNLLGGHLVPNADNVYNPLLHVLLNTLYANNIQANDIIVSEAYLNVQSDILVEGGDILGPLGEARYYG